ncbi:ATP-dependent nuclease [Thalassobaculum salexigens]|uniref:ATP-dependent nuclease n=1 Tax=Thalassobaculum salexigens TaxID=455360 RepID=UPI0003FC0E47|nr:AAA family ATPase [Thalassobaculum salexigens]
MAYKNSQIDKSNFKWFENDDSRASLREIRLTKGTIRGLTNFSISLNYPITVFSGGNGSGKSTILALATCAFHNKNDGFYPPLRNKNYYTFHDFFVQSSAETTVEGVEILYGIHHNRWHLVEPGIRFQARKKGKGGKWNDYDLRVDRNVIYFGVQRVVPHYERSTHKSYRSKFKPGTMNGEDRKRIAEIATRIIGKSYTNFDSYEHTKYTLPVASSNGISYSGFNMGAGEGSVFEILTALFAAGPGTLLVIDEIELGLHELAQVRLIDELKKLCHKMKCQIVCSTHSHAILRNLPPEARFHVESINEKTFITPGASPDFVCGKMGRPDAHELDIFVEDGVGVEMLQAALPAGLRKRVKIKSIGSHAAVIRQLSSRKLESIHNCICVLDGDQNGNLKTAISIAQSACECSTPDERQDVESWISERVFYLPGSDWPERWIIEETSILINSTDTSKAEFLMNIWGIESINDLINAFKEAEYAEKHGEFRDLSLAIDLTEATTRHDLISFVIKNRDSEFEHLIEEIHNRLP